MEIETIPEYIAIYHAERAALKAKFLDKDLHIAELAQVHQRQLKVRNRSCPNRRRRPSVPRARGRRVDVYGRLMCGLGGSEEGAREPCANSKWSKLASRSRC